MLEFKKVEIEDSAWMRPIIEREHSKSADFNFLGNYLWDAVYGYKIAKVEDSFTISVLLDGERRVRAYSFPIGSSNLKAAIDDLREEAAKQNEPLALCGVQPQHIEELHALGITDFRAEPFRAAFDYIYDAESLANLTGSKYHQKRNHIHRLEEREGWSFKRMEASDIEAVRAYNEKWFASQEDEPGLAQEKKVLDRLFDHFDKLDVYGGILYLDGEIIAYTIGEHYQTDCLQVSFEKAEAGIQGAYPMINREFVRMMREIFPEIQYVNREDDMGIPELQKAKESYHPIELVEKNNLFFE